MQTRLERSPNRTEIKSVVERKVRKEPKTSKEEESRSTKDTKSSREPKQVQKDTKGGQMLRDVKSGERDMKSGQVSKDLKSGQKSRDANKEPLKKGIMSDSIREMVRQSIEENRGLAQEVVEEESDESPERSFQVGADGRGGRGCANRRGGGGVTNRGEVQVAANS